MKVLFLCTGNTCRSAMAGVIAENIFARDAVDAQAASAGICVPAPESAADNAAAAAKGHGLDLSGHVSKQATEEELSRAELILTMSAGHKEYVLGVNKNANVYLLSEYAEGVSGGTDISDPFGGDAAVYEKCFAQLEGYIAKVSLRLKKEAGGLV